MNDTVDVAWIRDRLVSTEAISKSRAGDLIQAAMAAGSLKAVASHATRRPESSATEHTEEDYIEDDYAVPQEHWNDVQVRWDDRYLYFRFFHKKQVWLISALSVDRLAAKEFLRTIDPILSTIAASDNAALINTDLPVAMPKGKGGRPAKYHWAAAGGALAGHMFGAGIEEKSRLKEYILAWFQAEHGQTPDERDVEKFVAAALRAFDLATRKK